MPGEGCRSGLVGHADGGVRGVGAVLPGRDGLALDHSEPDFAIFRLPDGSRVEVFGPSDSEHRHFSTGPVAGFVVEDIDAARVALERAGAVFIGPVHGDPGGDQWAHFRAPDANVYEITRSPTFRRQ